MLYSAIGYILTLFMAFTIIPLLAFVMRMLLVLVFSRLYWSMGNDKTPVNVLKFSLKLAHPVGFVTAIFHGYAALWMGVVLLKGLGVDLDLFLPGILGFSFVWFGLRRLQKPADVKLENNLTTEIKEGEQTIVLNPEVKSESSTAEDPMKSFGQGMQDQLKDQAKEFMQGNTVVGLIGKVTGLALGTMKLVLPYIA